MEYRPALDGVRAFAVTAVLLFHGGVAALPGGFLGVDAFFVLSGFLITTLLLTEHATHGRIRLGRFWLRRARRLLPALLLLLAVVTPVFAAHLSAEDRTLLRDDALAALGYVANWRMLYRGEGYFAENAAPSPLQHTWSLGIEEQFYLLWPLVVVALLVWWARRPGALLKVAVVGAIASAVTAALLYAGADLNRAYFGTDARAQSLLVGAGLAVLLFGMKARESHPVLGGFAAASAAVVVLLWTGLRGTDDELYRGGLALGALAVATIIAHAMLSPRSPTARVLSLPPLVWLGRISYGVYLWHWPLFLFVNADRTGLTGPALLGVRLALTVAVATVSYVVIEQPVRTGRGLPRLSRPVAWAGAAAAVTLTAATIVATTWPRPTLVPTAYVPVPTFAPVTVDSGPPPPLQRPRRSPGPVPRVTFFGDSVSWSLGYHLPPDPNLAVTVSTVNGCGIVRLPEFRQLGSDHTLYARCPNWPLHWRTGVEANDPDLAVILLDRWELMDRKLDGRYQHVGEADFDAYLDRELTEALRIVSARGAHVVLLTAPYTRRSERPDGGLWPEDEPARVDAWNALLRTVAARDPGRVHVLDLNARACPDGEFTWTVEDIRLRSDGLHFTPAGVQQWIAPWLMPRLAALAAGHPPPPDSSPRGGTVGASATADGTERWPRAT